MDPISTADVFVALLRQKLAERAQAKGAGRKRVADPARSDGIRASRPVAERAARAGADDMHLRRIVVEQLLASRFGARLANDPRFQQIIGQVTQAIAQDEELGPLLADIIREARKPEQ
ncbi:MAG: hypothetical protein WCY29_13060 [Novosphingobium sp.]